MSAALDIAAVPPVPAWLRGCWQRAYIKQTFRAPRQIDEDNIVRYVQGSRLAIDMRLLAGRGGPPTTESMECFAGLTTVTPAAAAEAEEGGAAPSAPVVSWFPCMTFPLGEGADLQDERRSRASGLIRDVAGGSAKTEDRGYARLEAGAGASACAWLETDCETDGRELEERWERCGAALADEDDVEEWMSEDAVYLRAGVAFAACWRSGSAGSCFVYGSTRGPDGPVADRSQWLVSLSTDPSLEGKSLETVWDSSSPGKKLAEIWGAGEHRPRG